ncbi:OmpA family protein [Brevundimonas balnearis]|uniref:OmpA family protein n=1 Tax=Brevundimonas balnearis TaxID=1572858 RepID=A0ABV6R226_9CAUL
MTWVRGLAAVSLAALAAGCAGRAEDRAPLVAAPAACRAHVFEVYFREGEARLTDPAAEAVRLHADMVSACAVRAVQVVGLASATGSSSANLSLSERRAAEVARALAASGFPAPEFQLYAAGDQGAVTPTGAAEPLRRRVEVRIDAAPR